MNERKPSSVSGLTWTKSKHLRSAIFRVVLLPALAGTTLTTTTWAQAKWGSGVLMEHFQGLGYKNFREYCGGEVAKGRPAQEVREEWETLLYGPRPTLPPTPETPPGGWTEDRILEILSQTEPRDSRGVAYDKHSLRSLEKKLVNELGTGKTVAYLEDQLEEAVSREFTLTQKFEEARDPEARRKAWKPYSRAQGRVLGLERDIRTLQYHMATPVERRFLARKRLELWESIDRESQLEGLRWVADSGAIEALPLVEKILEKETTKHSNGLQTSLPAKIALELQRDHGVPGAYIRAAECDGSHGDFHGFGHEKICRIRAWGLRMMRDHPTEETTRYLRERVEILHRIDNAYEVLIGGRIETLFHKYDRPSMEKFAALVNMPKDDRPGLHDFHCVLEDVLASIEGRTSRCQECKQETSHGSYDITLDKVAPANR